MNITRILFAKFHQCSTIIFETTMFCEVKIWSFAFRLIAILFSTNHDFFLYSPGIVYNLIQWCEMVMLNHNLLGQLFINPW